VSLSSDLNATRASATPRPRSVHASGRWAPRFG